MDPAALLLARAEIADCVHGYALAIRRGDPAAAAALFTEAGAFEVREADPADLAAFRNPARAEGRVAIAAMVARSIGAVRMLPMIHNLIVTLAPCGTRATATSLMIGRVWPGEREIPGEYADSFVREAGGWRFSERIYTRYAAS